MVVSSAQKTTRISAHPQDQRLPHASVKLLNEPEVHHLDVARMDAFGNPDEPIPQSIVLIRPTPSNPGNDQLFLDKVPVARESWSYDVHDRILRWRGAFGGGQIHIRHFGRGATGMIGLAENAVSVSAGARATFLCSVAENCGATYETASKSVVGLKWDTSSAAWKNASWIDKRLLLTYTVTQQTPIAPPTFSFTFEDKLTGALPWQPMTGSFAASLNLGQHDNHMEWDLTFKSSIPAPEDQGQKTAPGPDSVFPYWLQAVEDTAASTINGVIEIDAEAPNGQLIGIQGERALPSAVGYYRVSKTFAPFAVFDGLLHVDGKPVARSYMSGNELYWSALTPQHQQALGLPGSGAILFHKDGSSAKLKTTPNYAQRIGANEAFESFVTYPEVHQNVHAASKEHALALADEGLSMNGLLPMTPFGKDSQGNWGDVVQEAVRGDLHQIMNAFVSPDIWKLLFPGIKQPTLDGELATVAHTPVKGVDDPISWYKQLGTAVMTQGMAGGSDKNCSNMNGPRAGAWLKEKVANSPVYQAHSQLLFHNQWLKRFPQISDYIEDQQNNSDTHQSIIDQQVKISIEDIEQNVEVSAGAPSDTKKKLENFVREVGEYAKENKLYWAFAYYTYNTQPGVLANIAIQMSINTGSSDGTGLSRLFQQNITVLTALDPSGYFARQYNRTINTFLATNILPSMYGFTGDADSFDLIKEYLEAFVKNTIGSEDPKIAQAAQQIKNILEQEDSEEMIKSSIDMLRSLSAASLDALALPYIANEWLTWFSSSYPKLSRVGEVFGSVLIGGITAMAVFNLFLEYKNWNKLTAGEKAEVILESVQFGVQILSAVVKRGIRIYAIFDVEGMSGLQRFGAISRILAQGEAEQLDSGLVDISNNTARWLGDTAGSIEIRDEINALMNIGEDELEEVSWTVRIFGRNLDEFIASRLGPVLILAGIGLSIYFISTGESGVSLASDIINIVGGSLMLFATIGGWLIEGGIIVAEGVMASIIAIAGPLAIIAALVGIGLMLYEMFKKDPDPVEEFVNNYVKPAKLWVRAKCSAIDYVIPYADKDQDNLMMRGFTLSASGQYLNCAPDGEIKLGDATVLPKTVWKVATDGAGMSRIVTITQPDGKKSPLGLLLSLMGDGKVSFQPKMTKKTPNDRKLKVVTQTWLSIPEGDANLSNDGSNLASLPLKLQAVIPDTNGNLDPSQASGWLEITGNGVAINESTGSEFKLSMSGIAPNFMSMADLDFALNSSPSTNQVFGPRFGTLPSTPLKFSISKDLPSFLTFDEKTGKIQPNGKEASTETDDSYQLTAASSMLGEDSVTFRLRVTPF